MCRELFYSSSGEPVFDVVWLLEVADDYSFACRAVYEEVIFEVYTYVCRFSTIALKCVEEYEVTLFEFALGSLTTVFF